MSMMKRQREWEEKEKYSTRSRTGSGGIKRSVVSDSAITEANYPICARKMRFVPDIAYNENGAKTSPHNSSSPFLRKHPSLRGRHAPLVWLWLEKACEHMSLECLDKWKRAGEDGSEREGRRHYVGENQSPDLCSIYRSEEEKGPPHVQAVLLQRCERKMDRIGEDRKRGGWQVWVLLSLIERERGSGWNGSEMQLPEYRRVKRFRCERRSIRHK